MIIFLLPRVGTGHTKENCMHQGTNCALIMIIAATISWASTMCLALRLAMPSVVPVAWGRAPEYPEKCCQQWQGCAYSELNAHAHVLTYTSSSCALLGRRESVAKLRQKQWRMPWAREADEFQSKDSGSGAGIAHTHSMQLPPDCMFPSSLNILSGHWTWY